MATINDTGIVPKTLSEYQTELRSAFQTAFGQGIDVDPKSPQGQFIDNLALSFSQNDDALVNATGAINIFSAFSSQLEGLAALLGIPRRAATSTNVTATLGGTPATVIPAGSRARSTAGDLFSLDEDATLGVGGTIDAEMSAVETGPIDLLTGQLSSVVDVVPGWETVINSSDGATGQDIESDSEYRQRYFNELFINALSVMDSIKAEISSVENVTEVSGYENDTGSAVIVQNVSIPAHAIAMIIEGGIDQDIADAIRLKKTGGTATSGTTSVPDAPNSNINFYRPSYIDLEVTITTTAGTGFPADGLNQLKTRTLNYINGTIEVDVEPGYFETDGMLISEDLYKHRLYTPINSVPGHTVTGLTMEDKASPGDVDLITADLIEKIRFLSIDDINVELS